MLILVLFLTLVNNLGALVVPLVVQDDVSTNMTAGEVTEIKGQSQAQSTSPVQGTCMSKECIMSAAELFQIMNMEVHPCEDFAQFVCGKYNEEAVVPDDKAKISYSFDQASIAIDERGRALLERLAKHRTWDLYESDAKLAKFYMSCIDEEKAQKNGLKPLLDLLNQVGGWPVLGTPAGVPAHGCLWNGTTDSLLKWSDTAILLAQKGILSNGIISIALEPDSMDIRTRRIHLDQPELGLPREYLVQGKEASEVKAYFSYMVDAAKLLGASPSLVEHRMRQVLEFEMALANMSAPKEERRDESKLYNPFTIDQLPSGKTVAGLAKGELKTFLEELLSGIANTSMKLDDGEKLVVKNVGFIMDSLQALLDKTDKSVVANYMGWRLVLPMMGYLNKEAQELQERFERGVLGKASQQPRWKTCVQRSGFNSRSASALHKAAGSLYVRNFFDKSAKDLTKEMIRYIMDAFRESLLGDHDWMDKDTAKKALLKLDGMQNYVGYVDELLQPSVLNRYFDGLKIVEDDFFGNTMAMNRFSSSNEVKRFREPVDPYDWRDNSLTALVNAFYSPDSNVFKITSGILQKSFFGQGRPAYLNFGGIGSVIGHEITHGFDDQGRQRDHQGALVDWWSPQTSERFNQKAQCIVDQYGGYKADQVGLNLNGIHTQGENIADNGGVKVAYRGYEKWVEKKGPEMTLPGLSFTPKQLFWITYASTWCTKYTDKGLVNMVLTNEHAPGHFRIIGPLSNNKDFAKDFDCPLGSKMNPGKKCSVW